MLPNNARHTAYEPITFYKEMATVEDFDISTVTEWLETKKSQFGLDGKGLQLLSSLKDEASRKIMAEKYASYIKGFEKKPEVTITPGKNISPELIETLKNFELPTKYPPRLNLPCKPPDNTIHSTGPLAETVMMFFNTIIQSYYPFLMRLIYYGLTNKDAYEHSIESARRIILLIEMTASKVNASADGVKIIVNETIVKYCSNNNINMPNVMQHYASHKMKGIDYKTVPAVMILKEILANTPSHVHLRAVIKQMYLLCVNEVKIYQDNTGFKATRTTKYVKKQIPATEETITITGVVMPTATAVSPTFKPVTRLKMSSTCENDVFRLYVEPEDRISDTYDVGQYPDEIESGARYRLIIKKDGYVISSQDRYAPQIFLKMQYRFPADFEFGLNLRTGEVHIYCVHNPVTFGDIFNTAINAADYDPAVIELYRHRFKFKLSMQLGITKTHLAYTYCGAYAQGSHVPHRNGTVGNYTWERVTEGNGDTNCYEMVMTDDYNLLFPYVTNNLPERTKISKMCGMSQFMDDLQAEPFIVDASRWPDDKHDYPDYPHYNIPYYCSFDIETIQPISVSEARAIIVRNRGKLTVETKHKQKKLKLSNEVY